jgi:hypothetical protein
MFGLPAMLCGQTFSARNYATGDGLSHANVFRIFQDSEGFMWFCTDDGLSRFDGMSFRNYYTDDGLTNNCIMSLSEDSKGMLQVSTYGGGLCIVGRGCIHVPRIRKGIMPAKVLFSFPIENDLLLIGQDTVFGLYRLRNEVLSRLVPAGVNGTRVYFHSGYMGTEGTFFATNTGVFTYNKTDGLQRFLPDNIHEPVTVVSGDGHGNLWIGLESKLLKVQGQKVLLEIPVVHKGAISDILVDKQDQVWVSIAGTGICLVDGTKLKNINDRLHLSTYVINDLFEDREGNIWVATHGEGVLKVSNQNLLNYGLAEGKLNVYHTSISPYAGKLILGSIGTIGIFNEGQIAAFPIINLHSPQYVYFSRVIGHTLYIGTPLGLIAKDMLVPGHERIIKCDDGTAPGIISIFFDNNHTIWAGGYQGLYQVKDNKLIPQKIDSAIVFKRINAITQDANGMLWLGSDKGLIYRSGDGFREFNLNTREPVNVLSLFEDNSRRLWFGHDKGLGCISLWRATMIGYPGLQVNCFAQDKNNTIWLGTSKGLKYIDEHRNIKDLYAEAFRKEVLSLYCTDTMLYAGTTSGMITIENDKSFVPHDAPPETYIVSAITATGTVYMPLHVSVPYNRNKISVNFIGLNYKEPELVEYRYKIDHLDNQWRVTGNTYVELAGLPDGEFAFILNSRLKGGEWGKDHVMNITVATPIWKRWWFIAAAVLLAAVLFYLGARYLITRKERKKRERLVMHNRMAHMRQQALTALVNPHFIFNCMNSIQHYMNENDNDAANEFLSLFSKLIRMTLEYSAASFIDLNKELSRINLYLTLEQLRFGDGLKFEILMDKELENEHIRIPNMILQPFLENAVWHGIMPKEGIGMIKVFVKREGESLRIIIEDDGIGIVPNRKVSGANQSLGMKLISERMALLERLSGQTFRIAVTQLQTGSEAATGTRIEIITPVHPDEQALSKVR